MSPREHYHYQIQYAYTSNPSYKIGEAVWYDKAQKGIVYPINYSTDEEAVAAITRKVANLNKKWDNSGILFRAVKIRKITITEPL